MKLSMRTLFGDAWRLWLRHRMIVGPVAGLFLFVPQWALLILLPAPPVAPALDSEAAVAAHSAALAEWLGAQGVWFLLGLVLWLYGTLAIAGCLLDRQADTVGAALVRAIGLVLRYLLAGILVILPASILVGPALLLPGGGVVLGVLILWLLARTLPLPSVLVAERPMGAFRAILASWRRTAGSGAVLTAALALVMVGGQGLAGAVQLAGAAVGEGGIGAAVFGGLSALAMATATLAATLMGIAAYLRLSPRQGS